MPVRPRAVAQMEARPLQLASCRVKSNGRIYFVEVVRLTDGPLPGNVKCMSRFTFGAWCWLMAPAALLGQSRPVPGRDLLDFPIGSMAEARPLASELGAGLWNPASIAMPAGDRLRLGVVALNSPQDQAVTGSSFTAATALPRGVTVSLSATRMSVADLLRTETDPQSIGGEIPYNTTVYSASAALRRGPAVFGAAVRYRSGVDDIQRGGAVALDGGVIVDRVLGTPLRVAGSTFLFSPTRRGLEPATFLAAADVPLVHGDSTWEIRSGYSVTNTEARSHEGYLFASARYGQIDARGGLAQSTDFGNTTRRVRLGMGLHYARYSVGIAREDSGAGIGATYQFLLTTVFR